MIVKMKAKLPKMHRNFSFGVVPAALIENTGNFACTAFFEKVFEQIGVQVTFNEHFIIVIQDLF